MHLFLVGRTSSLKKIVTTAAISSVAGLLAFLKDLFCLFFSDNKIIQAAKLFDFNDNAFRDFF